jgi:uncharacterized membrane protein YqjE
MTEDPVGAESQGADAFGDSLVDDVRQLIEEGRELARAELAYQKSRAAFAAAQAPRIIALVVVALVLVFFALMALVVGTVFALGPVIGRWGAMIAVTTVLLFATVICLLRARSRFARTKRLLADGERT